MSAEWTLEPQTCAFCKKAPDNGYALQDKEGKWQPACWPCVKKHLKTQEEDPSVGF